MSYSQLFIQLHQLSFQLPDGKCLFEDLNFLFSYEKVSLIGRNGIGKTTLLSLIAGYIKPSAGHIECPVKIHYAPQMIHNENQTIAEFLKLDKKLIALSEIEKGSLNPIYFNELENHWDVREQFKNCLLKTNLNDLMPDQRISQLSGGERTRLIISRALMDEAPILLLDEPTNHLDRASRQWIYNIIEAWQGMLIVASHDRELLNHLDAQIEVTTKGLFRYGGNYEHYQQQKEILENAKQLRLQEAKQDYKNKLRTQQQSREKLEQKRSYGKALRKKGSIDKLQANSKRGQSERTQSRHQKMFERMQIDADEKLKDIQAQIEVVEDIVIHLEKTNVPQHKKVLTIEHLHFSHENQLKKIIENFSLQVVGAKRIAICGENGSGKSTLCQLLTSQLKPNSGNIQWHVPFVYLDQHTHCLNPELSLIENFFLLQPSVNLQQVHHALAQYLFKNVQAEKKVKALSGGERLRAALACLLYGETPPQCLILDEPSNHLDIASLTLLEKTLAQYSGALIVVSHDAYFLKQIGCDYQIIAPFHERSEMVLYF